MDPSITQLLQNIFATQSAQGQSITQLNHDYTNLSVSMASIAKDVEWLKWLVLTVLAISIAQGIKMVYDHLEKKNGRSQKK